MTIYCSSCEQDEYSAEPHEIGYVTSINHPATDRAIVLVDSQTYYNTVQGAQQVKVANGLKAYVYKEAKEHCDDKCHNLILGDAARKYTNAYKCSTQESQADIGTEYTPLIDIAYRLCEVEYTEVID